MKIRLAKPEDANDIVTLFREWEKLADVYAIEIGITNKLVFFIVCEVDNKIVGMLSFTMEWCPSSTIFWWNVANVYTLKDFRKQGVCKAILNGLTELARTTPTCFGIKLVVGSNNPASNQYTNAGFKETNHLEMVYYV